MKELNYSASLNCALEVPWFKSIRQLLPIDEKKDLINSAQIQKAG